MQRGLDAEVFTFKALRKAVRESVDPYEREHVTQYFFRNPILFKQINTAYKVNISYLRWTIDNQEDLEMARRVYSMLYQEGKIFLMEDILDLLSAYPEISKMNLHVKRSAMYEKS